MRFSFGSLRNSKRRRGGRISHADQCCFDTEHLDRCIFPPTAAFNSRRDEQLRTECWWPPARLVAHTRKSSVSNQSHGMARLNGFHSQLLLWKDFITCRVKDKNVEDWRGRRVPNQPRFIANKQFFSLGTSGLLCEVRTGKWTQTRGTKPNAANPIKQAGVHPDC